MSQSSAMVNNARQSPLDENEASQNEFMSVDRAANMPNQDSPDPVSDPVSENLDHFDIHAMTDRALAGKHLVDSSIFESDVVQEILLGDLGSPGFWGKVTSTVDWCEQNYQHSSYVAETWNTSSNLITIMLGCLTFVHFVRHNTEKRFRITAIALAVVGAGSLAFHGTLLYTSQLLDEIPMLMLAASMTYMTLESASIEHKYPGLPLYASIFCILFSLGHIFLQHAELFFLVFALLLIPSVVFSVRNRGSEQFFGAAKRAFYFLVTGYACWEVDRHFCDHVEHLYLHAWWHIFTALSEIYFINAMLHLRRGILQLPSRLVLGGLWLDMSGSNANGTMLVSAKVTRKIKSQ